MRRPDLLFGTAPRGRHVAVPHRRWHGWAPHVRAPHVREWFRGQPGHLGPNPDQLVVALVAVVAAVTVAVALITILGPA
ncbi:MAG: hypothetical protein ACRDO2_14280 [Nocardioidaceae bacterium]